MRQPGSRNRADERGTSVLELALLMPVLLLLVMGTLDLGRAVYMRNALASAARDAARFASIDPANTACIQTLAARNSSIANVVPAGVTIGRPASLAVGQPITVTVQTTYQPATSMVASAIGVNSVTMSAAATVQIRNVPSGAVSCPPPPTP